MQNYDFDGTNIISQSEYVNDYHLGGGFCGGFRINPINKRIAINILPINFRFGTKDYLEFNSKIEIDIKR